MFAIYVFCDALIVLILVICILLKVNSVNYLYRSGIRGSRININNAYDDGFTKLMIVIKCEYCIQPICARLIVISILLLQI